MSAMCQKRTSRQTVGTSLRQSCLAQALNEADAVLRPPERRRYPVNIAKAQRERFGLALADETLAARKKKGKAA